jgi:2-polyprenyl-3-methyl-5-hydroxy-6-metoxy-1,4-benzoquinol methylase
VTDGAGYVPFNARPHRAHEKLVRYIGSAGRVLDVGCSTGYLAQRLVESGNAVVGVEFDPDAAERARRWCERVVVGDVEMIELPFEPGSFDAVVAADVIEHLRAPERFLARARPLLRPGGRLVVSTPNVANWAMRLSLLAGRWRYTERGILDRTHTRLFTRTTLVEAVEAAGYRVEVLDFTVPVPLVDSSRVEALAHAVGRLRPSLFAYQFVVVASPR